MIVYIHTVYFTFLLDDQTPDTTMIIAKLKIFLFISFHFGLSLQSVCKRNINITGISPYRCKTELENIVCGSLQEALTTLKDSYLEDSCVHLEKDCFLNTTITKENLNNLQIISTQSSTINCGGATLRFYNSTGISFSNVSFKDCGYETEILWNEQKLNISVALFFNQCKRITLSQCTLNSSHGYGLAFIDSNDVSITNVLVLQSVYNHVWYHDRTVFSGGGIFIHFQSEEFGDNNSISIMNSEFSNTSTNSIAWSFSSVFDDLPYGRGAGVLFSCYSNRENNSLNIDNSNISYNTGNVGSGVYIIFREKTQSNKFIFTAGRILGNQAETSGGGVFAHSSSNQRNIFLLKDSILSDNEGEIGGGIAFVRPKTYTEYTQSCLLSLENVTMNKNNAQVGAAIHLQNVLAHFNNVTVDSSSVRLIDHSPGKGSVYALRSILTFLGEDNCFFNNNNSAVIVDDSHMLVNGTITFHGNLGYNGGALAFYEHSKLVLQDISHLLFIKNYASNHGGAMYILSPGPSLMPWKTLELNTYTCFIDFFNTTYHQFQGCVKFEGNKCTDGDSHDIFMSSLRSCRHLDDETNRHIFKSWSNFNFTNNETYSTIATNAVKFRPLDANEWISYSGNLLKPHIVLNDELDNNVSESINVIVIPNDKVKIASNPAFVVSTDDSIKLQLKQLKRVDCFNISVKTTSHLFLESNISNLYFDRCPFGFSLDSTTRVCECDISRNEEKYIAYCDSEDIYLHKNTWVHLESEKTFICPREYCRNNDTKHRYNLFNRSQQCAKNRDQLSRLCSKCLANFSAVSGKHTCEPCPPGSMGVLYVVMLIAAGLLLLIALIMLANIDIMSYNLNICLYSYQIIYLLYSPEQRIDVFLSFIMSIFQVSPRNNVYPTVCLWYGMTAMGKISFGFIIPGFMLLFMLFLYCACKQKNWMDRWYRAMSIIVVMCFSDLIRLSFQLLHFVTIGNGTYVFDYADELYFGPNHLPYAVVSVIILVFIAVFTIIQIVLLLKPDFVTPQWLWRFDNRVGNHFKRGRRWFWLVYFVFRALIYGVGIFMINWVKLQMAMLSFLCFVFMCGFALLQPHNNRSVNIVETAVLATLTVVSVLGDGIRYVYSVDEQDSMISVVQVLSYFPIGVVVLSILKDLFLRFRPPHWETDRRG